MKLNYLSIFRSPWRTTSWGKLGAKPTNAPMILNVQLTHGDMPFEDPKRYRRLVVKLNYVAVIHPYTVYSVSVVSQYMLSPTVDHWNVVEHIFCYLKVTPG
ncbi:unnamed protein product [Cuscuta epithymum]|uniref:Mitochondrial protein n=1 Tax=Cuscuta epithymum TaxID=186058 RepID=A0AAV0G9X8_9ASTE|nr:unnamed protein product [Cuscuta epithymum]